jgi:hypothetical protein
MNRVLQLAGITIMVCQLYSCSSIRVNISVFTPTLSSTSTYSNTLESRPSSTMISTEYPTLKPDPTGQLLENGWYRYINHEAGYLIDFPPDARLETDNPKILDFTQAVIRFPGTIDPSGVAMLITTYINIEDLSLEQFVENHLNKQFDGGKPPEVFGSTTIKATIISGHSAILFDANLYRLILFIEAKDKFYTLSLVPNMMVGNPTTIEATDLFYKIVNTFKIL